MRQPRSDMQTSLRQISDMLKAKGNPGEAAIDRVAGIASQMLHPTETPQEIH